MPIARVQMEDGRIARFEVPEGTSPEQVLQMAGGSAPAKENKYIAPHNLIMGGLKGAANIGTTLMRPVDAALNAVGLTDKTNVERKADIGRFFGEQADTGSGWFKGGELASEIAGTAGAGGVLARGATAAGQAIPALAGAASRIAPALESGGMSLTARGAAPRAAGSFGERLMDMGIRTGAGAATGAAMAGLVDPETAGTGAAWGAALPAGVMAAGRLGRAFSGRLPESAKGMNKAKDAILRESQEAGYVVPKSEVAPSFLNNRMESLAGKAALKQEAGKANQEATNALARKMLGLAPDEQLGIDTLEKYRASVSGPYREIAALNPEAEAALEAAKTVRAEAKDWWRHYNMSGTPTSRTAAKALDAEVKKLEDSIDLMAMATGRKGLVKEMREARKLIAQTHDLERAMNPATGDVSAKVIARLYDKGKGKVMTDELKTIARFAKTFPQYAPNGNMVPAAGVSALEPFAMAALAMGGGASGGVGGTLAGGLPMLRGPARSMLLSKPYQQNIVKRKYQGDNKLANLLTSDAARAALIAGTN